MICDLCGTPLRHGGFVTEDGRLSCGRSKTQRTVNQRGRRSLAKVALPCAKAAERLR